MSNWISGPASIPAPDNDTHCCSREVRFVFNENNKSVYRVCEVCWVAKAVRKSQWIHNVKGTLTEFNEAKRVHFESTWRQKQSDLQQDLESLPEESFYSTPQWLKVRYEVLAEHFKKHGHTCLCCKHRFVPLHVDHVKPRSMYPALALDKSNLQVLCDKCNRGKSNRDETDFRVIA